MGCDHIVISLVFLYSHLYFSPQCLIRNSFNTSEPPTQRKEEYYPSLVYESSILECRVVDIPKVDKFPASSEDEWDNQLHYGLRNADAYLLVYDVTRPSSFQYLQQIRDQIAMSRGLCELPIVVAAAKTDLANDEIAHDNDRGNFKSRHDITSKVKKAWKLNHTECSARYNWNINSVFRELASEILSVRNRRNGIYGKFEKKKCCFVCI